MLCIFAWSIVAVIRNAVGLPQDSGTPSCAYAIAIDAPRVNSECRALCEAGKADTSEFTSTCAFITISTDPLYSSACYTGLIYGYVLNAYDPLTVGYQSYRNIQTAQECQEYCQRDQPRCKRWIWQTIEAAEKHPSRQPNCYLKSQDYLDHAWYGSSPSNDLWCNPETTSLCNRDPDYHCMGTKTCIWCSRAWLGHEPWCTTRYLTTHPLGPEGNQCWWHDVDGSSSTTTLRPADTTFFPTTQGGGGSTDGGDNGGSTNGGDATNTGGHPDEESTTVIPPPSKPVGAIIGGAFGGAALLAGVGASVLVSRRISAPVHMEGNFEGEGGQEIDADRDVGAVIDEEAFG